MIINKIQDSDLQSFNVDSEIIVDKNVVGEFIKDTANLVVFNENHKYDDLDKTYIDIKNFGEWFVEDIENDEENESLTLKLCDKSREFDENYEDTFPFPASMKAWATWIGEKVGIPLKGNFLNENLILTEKPYMGNNPKWRNAVKIISKYASSWADINNDGTYSIKWFEDKVYQIDDWETFKHGLTTKPTNVLILSTGVTEDNVRWPEIIPEEPHELRIEDDWTNINRYEINEAIYNQVNGFFYTPISNLTLLYGIFELLPGQKIKTKDFELNDIETYISSHTLNWDGGTWEDPDSWTSTLKMLDLKETTTKYQYSNSIENRLGKAEIACDKNNKRINMLVEDVDDIEKDITTSKTAEGNPIEVTDAGEYPIESIEIDGKSHQKIYKGNQLVDLSNMSKTSNTNYTFENDILIESCVNQTYPTIYYNITDIAKANKGKKLYFNCESYNYSNGNKPNVGLQISRKKEDGTSETSYVTLFDYLGNKTSYTIPNDFDNIVSIRFRFICNNTSTAGDYSASWTKPILSFEENIEYEPYVGAIPSPNPEYPQEIEVVEGKEIEGKEGKWLKQIAIGKNKYNDNYPIENAYYDANGNKIVTFTVGELFINQKYISINKKLCFSFKEKVGNAFVRLCEYKKDNTFIKRTLINSNTEIILSDDTYFVIWSVDKRDNVYFIDLQIEEGKITPYEEYKENVALIDMNIYDEDGNIIGYHKFASINDTSGIFLNGSFTEKIGNVVFNGDEKWNITTSFEGYLRFSLVDGIAPYKNNKAINNRFTQRITQAHGAYEYIYLQPNTNVVYVQILPSRLETSDVAGFKKYLNKNAIELYYELNKPRSHELNYESLKLHKGYNYITLNDDLYPNMNIKYLTDSKFNADYATKSEVNMKSNEIILGVNGKLKNYSTTTETNALIDAKVEEESASINLAVSQKIEDIQIGGTNLVPNSEEEQIYTPNEWISLCDIESASYGEKYTISFDAWVVYKQEESGYTGPVAQIGSYIEGDAIAGVEEIQASLTTKPQRITYTYTVNNDDEPNSKILGLSAWAISENEKIHYKKIKVEKGTKATDWSPAPKDIEAKLELKVGKNEYDEIISMLNMAAGVITLAGGSKINITTAGKLIISAGNFQLDESGNIKATGGEIGGFSLSKNKFSADINSIYKYNDNDLKMIRDIILNRTVPTEAILKIFDTNDSGTIDAADMLKIQRILDGSLTNTKSVSGTFSINTNDPKYCISMYSGNTLMASLGFGQMYFAFAEFDIALVGGKRVVTSTYTGSQAIFSIGMSFGEKNYMEIITGEGAYGVDVWYSDKRLKHDISDTKIEALPIIEKIRHREFISNDDKDNKLIKIGYVADELKEIDEQLIFEVGEEKIKHPSTSYLMPLLSKAIQEQQQQINDLTKKVEKLEKGYSMKKAIKIINVLLILLNILLVILILKQPRYLPEDVNKDGEVNALDLLIVQKYILKENEGEENGRIYNNN